MNFKHFFIIDALFDSYETRSSQVFHGSKGKNLRSCKNVELVLFWILQLINVTNLKHLKHFKT